MKNFKNNTQNPIRFSLNAKGKSKSFDIPVGGSADLPEENLHVASLVEQNMLVEVPVKDVKLVNKEK